METPAFSIEQVRAFATFLRRAEEVADAYISRFSDENYNYYEGLSEITDDHVTVTADVGGCTRGCCPSYTASFDIPIRYFLTENFREEMDAEKQRQEAEKKRAEEEKQRQEAEKKRQEAEERARQREARDQAEYLRLKAKFEVESK